MYIDDLKHDLAEALVASSQGQLYLGIEGVADELEALDVSYRLHAHAIRSFNADPAGLKVELMMVLAKLQRPA